MKRRLIAAGTRWLMTFLLSAGLTLPILTVLDAASSWQAALAVNAALSLLPALAGMGGRFRLFTLLGGTAGLALWLAGTGISDCVELVRGIVLQLTETTGVFPLIAGRAVPILAGAVTALAFLAASPAAGGLPALCLWVVSLMLLWMGGQDSAMLLTVPALTAGLTMLGLERRGGRLRSLLPLMALLSLCACLLVPSGGVTVEPLKEAADQLREQVSDYLFYTAPRSVFSLADLGWYPQGQNQLGGTPDPSDDLLLAVKTTRRTYLRGAVKDRYTGRSWLDTLGSRRYLWVNPAMTSQKDALFDMSRPLSGTLVPGQVQVTVLASGTSTLMVPQRLRQLSVTSDMVLYFNDASEVFITRDLAAGDTYTASAPLVAAGDPGLREMIVACASASDPRYEAMVESYTELPDHLQSQVYALAREAAGQGTDYDRALNLQSWLQTNCSYTLEVERQSSSVDFVSDFLLNSRQGYCTYFASAMTVMCRMVGIPARYVEGFVADPEADGTAYVTGWQGHAWTEVYLSGFGWLTFDATPQTSISGSSGIQPLPDTSGSSPAPTPSPSGEPSPAPSAAPSPEPTEEPELDEVPTEDPDEEPDEESDEEPDEEEQPGRSGFPWLLLLVAALLACAGALVWRVLSRRPDRLAAKAPDEPARCAVWMTALTDALALLGMDRRPEESPMAWMRRLTEQEGLPKQLTDAGALQTVLSYGRYVPTEHESAMMRRACRALLARLNRRQLALYHLRRGLRRTDSMRKRLRLPLPRPKNR